MILWRTFQRATAVDMTEQAHQPRHIPRAATVGQKYSINSAERRWDTRAEACACVRGREPELSASSNIRDEAAEVEHVGEGRQPATPPHGKVAGGRPSPSSHREEVEEVERGRKPVEERREMSDPPQGSTAAPHPTTGP